MGGRGRHAVDWLLCLAACGTAGWSVCASAASAIRLGNQIVLTPDVVRLVARVGVLLAVALAVFLLSGRAFRLLAGHGIEVPEHGCRSIEAFALYLALAGAPAWALPATARDVLYFAAPLLGLVWLWGRRSGTGLMRTEVGLFCGRGAFIECTWGMIAAMLVCPVAALIQLGGASLGSGAGSVPAVLPTELARGKLLLGILLIVVWAPVVEETMFRGVLYGGLRSTWRWMPAAIVSALIWTLLHAPVNIWPSHLFVALACAYLREWRCSVIGPVVVHAAYNSMAIAPALKLLAGF